LQQFTVCYDFYFNKFCSDIQDTLYWQQYKTGLQRLATATIDGQTVTADQLSHYGQLRYHLQAIVYKTPERMTVKRSGLLQMFSKTSLGSYYTSVIGSGTYSNFYVVFGTPRWRYAVPRFAS
jgi:hypothetical protein